MHQNDEFQSQYEEERLKVRLCEQEGLALRRAFQKQAEQLLFTSEIALPRDERMAARGLSPKLHWWQIPEIKAFASLCEDALAHLSEVCAERTPTILSILTLLAYGVHGVAGLSIVREAVVSHEGLKILSLEVCPTDMLCKLSGLVLKRARTTAKHNIKKRRRVCLNRRQGRYGRFSGRQFLVAAKTTIAKQGAALVVDMLTPVMEHILKHGHSKGLTGPRLSQLLDATKGRMVFAITAGRTNRLYCRTVWRASGYSSMDFARWVVLWGLASGRLQSSVLDDKSFAIVQRSQSKLALEEAARAGVVTASNLALKIAALQTVATAATDMPLVGGLSSQHMPFGGSPLPPKPYLLCWPTVWAHFGEVGIVRQDFDRTALQDLMNFRFSDLHAAVAAELHRLAESPEHIKYCHTARVVSVAMSVPTWKPQPSCPPARIHKKTNVTKMSKSRLTVVHLGKGKTRRERVHKSTVVCPACGNAVRKDNIARHKASKFCVNRSRARS